MPLSTSKTIAIIIGLSAIAFVFTSSLIINSEHAAQAKPNKKDIDKIIKKVKEKLKDRDNDEEKDEEKEVKAEYDYNFADEGDTNRKDFNFVAAGDYGCSKNTGSTINNMKDKKPELVLPLGDLSVDSTATCWLDLVSTFINKLQITFGYHDVKNGE